MFFIYPCKIIFLRYWSIYFFIHRDKLIFENLTKIKKLIKIHPIKNLGVELGRHTFSVYFKKKIQKEICDRSEKPSSRRLRGMNFNVLLSYVKLKRCFCV